MQKLKPFRDPPVRATLGVMSQTVATHIELRPNRDGQPRAFIVGTRVRVQDIYVMSELEGKSPDEIVQALPHLSLAQVHAGLSYYFDHRESILGELRDDGELAERLRADSGRGPLFDLINRPTGDALSS